MEQLFPLCGGGGEEDFFVGVHVDFGFCGTGGGDEVGDEGVVESAGEAGEGGWVRGAEGVAEAVGEPFGGDRHEESDAVAFAAVGGGEFVVEAQANVRKFRRRRGHESRDFGRGDAAGNELVEDGGEVARPGEDSARGESVGGFFVVGFGGFSKRLLRFFWRRVRRLQHSLYRCA